MQDQAIGRRGESLRRLQSGHGHAERLFLQQVWWPAFGQFAELTAEYELSDYNDSFRYLDFAFERLPLRLAIEIDGFGPHCRELNREQFSAQLMRQNHLIIDGWQVIRFSFDDVKDRPRTCQRILEQLIGKWFGSQHQEQVVLTAEESAILRHALQNRRMVTPTAVCQRLGVGRQKARKLLHRLTAKGMLVPSGAAGNKTVHTSDRYIRICCYQLAQNVRMEQLN